MKRKIVYSSIIIFIFFVKTLFAGVDVGIISALHEEIKNIKKEIKIEDITKIANFTFYKGKLENKEVVLVKSGIGKVNAACCAALLISKFDPNIIIFTGVAGGINERIKIGDIIISKDLVIHDFGRVIKEGFEPTPLIIANKPIKIIKADKKLVKSAFKVIKKIKFKRLPKALSKERRLPKIYIGRIITGDQFIANEKKRKYLRKMFKADVVEMEGAAVGLVSLRFNKPFLVIRIASDLANEYAEVDFEKFCKYVAPISAEIITHLLKYLPGGRK